MTELRASKKGLLKALTTALSENIKLVSRVVELEKKLAKARGTLSQIDIESEEIKALARQVIDEEEPY